MVTELQHHQESGALIIGGAIKRTIDSNPLINSCHFANGNDAAAHAFDSKSFLMTCEI